MNNGKLELQLKNGDKLVAEFCPEYDGAQLAVGIVDANGNYIQDLVVVETSGVQDRNAYKVYLYRDEYDECYTDNYEINRISSNAI